MKKFLLVFIGSFIGISTAECTTHVLYRSGPNRSTEEAHLMNQREQQLQMQKESLEMQRQMLNEYKRNNPLR